jgi:hypothetical protein
MDPLKQSTQLLHLRDEDMTEEPLIHPSYRSFENEIQACAFLYNSPSTFYSPTTILAGVSGVKSVQPLPFHSQMPVPLKLPYKLVEDAAIL